MLSTPQVVVVSFNRGLIRHVRRSLASAGFTVGACPFQMDAIRPEVAAMDGICLIDADEDYDDVRAVLQLLRTERPDVIPLLLSHESDNSFILDLLMQERLNNLIARQGALSASSELIDENELIVTCAKLLKRDIFGIQKYLPTWAIRIRERTITCTQDKQEAMQELGAFLEQIDCYGAIRNSIMLVGDELLMNAIFNAPRDSDGNPKYAEVDRREQFQLLPHEQVQLRYGCDGRNVALSVSDQFGSLDRRIIVKYLQRAFTDRQAAIEEKKGGAGLGLYMVFNSITQLTFNIHAGKATEVIAAFYVRSGARAFRLSGRSLNFFFIQD